LRDYLTAEEIDKIISGRIVDLDQTKRVRDWNKEEYVSKFWEESGEVQNIIKSEDK
jgi:hypothetical protein